MYFIELVTTEHKLGITTLCIKKSAPREKWKQSVFNIPCFSFSAPLPRFAFRHSDCLARCLRMYAETEQHCFYILLSRGICLALSPLHVPLPLPSPTPPLYLFYLLRLPKADAVISPAFNSLSHPLASPFFKSCLPLFSGCTPYGSRYLLGGAGDDVKLGGWGVEEKGGRVRMMERRRESV